MLPASAKKGSHYSLQNEQNDLVHVTGHVEQSEKKPWAMAKVPFFWDHCPSSYYTVHWSALTLTWACSQSWYQHRSLTTVIVYIAYNLQWDSKWFVSDTTLSDWFQQMQTFHLKHRNGTCRDDKLIQTSLPVALEWSNCGNVITMKWNALCEIAIWERRDWVLAYVFKPWKT